MKLLLRKDIPRLGLCGDVVEVSAGYARNYLLPHHLAMPPTPGNLKRIEEEKKIAAALRAQRRAELEATAKRLEGVEVTIAAAANREGTLYGSVGPREVAAALREEGHAVEAAQVHMPEPIRVLDTRTVTVQFAEDIATEVKVWVVREKGADFEDDEGLDEQEEGTDADEIGTGHVDALADD